MGVFTILIIALFVGFTCRYPVCNIIEVSKGDSYQVSELGIRMHIEYSPLYDDCNVNSVCYSIIENYRRNIKVTNKSNTFGIISSTGELKVDDEPRVCLLAVFMPISLYDDNSRILEIIHGIVTQISKMYIVVPSTPPCVSMGCLVLVPYQCVSTNNSPLCSKLWLRVFDICCSKNLMWKIEYVIVCDVSILRYRFICYQLIYFNCFVYVLCNLAVSHG